MSGWIPEKGEKYTYEIAVVETVEKDGTWVFRYEPTFAQQRCAYQEMGEAAFREFFRPAGSCSDNGKPGSHWRMTVAVLAFDEERQLARFKYESTSGQELGGIEMPVHVFNATFRRAAKEESNPDLSRKLEYQHQKERSLKGLRMPCTGEVWNLYVVVRGITLAKDEEIFIKYQPLDLPGFATEKELPEKDFTANFVNAEHGMTDIKMDGKWVMRVKVVDVDEREDAVWYRKVTGEGEWNSLIKRMSTHVFISSFTPPDK